MNQGQKIYNATRPKVLNEGQKGYSYFLDV